MTVYRSAIPILICAATIAVAGCRSGAEEAPPHATGYVEATDVRVATKVSGRVATVAVIEGARIEAGAVVATISTTDVDLALARVRAERAQAAAQLDLLLSGSRPEDIRQAEAQAAAAGADRKAAEAEVSSARADEARFEQLLANKAGSAKQRDDAVARRELAEARLRATADRLAAASATVDRLKAGARPQEIASARARVATVDAQIASMEHDKSEAVIASPIGGVVAGRLVEPGELVAVGTPLAIVVDLDHAWANVYVEETLVPHIKLDQAATVVTDAGDRLPGRVSFIASRAEFTPRNVQTANERAKLVYRIKVSVDNSKGILKPGMPVEVDLALPGR
jgi:HlyD family secretion protein